MRRTTHAAVSVIPCFFTSVSITEVNSHGKSGDQRSLALVGYISGLQRSDSELDKFESRRKRLEWYWARLNSISVSSAIAVQVYTLHEGRISVDRESIAVGRNHHVRSDFWSYCYCFKRRWYYRVRQKYVVYIYFLKSAIFFFSHHFACKCILDVLPDC